MPNIEFVLLGLEITSIIDVSGRSTLIKVNSHVASKSDLSEDHFELHDVLLRIEKFAKTEIVLYGKSRDTSSETNIQNDYGLSPSHIRFTKVCTNYYGLPECVPTEDNFREWIESLEEPMKSDFKKKGFKSCVGVLNYRRFILESLDIGMDEYLRNNLSPEDYSYYKNRDS